MFHLELCVYDREVLFLFVDLLISHLCSYDANYCDIKCFEVTPRTPHINADENKLTCRSEKRHNGSPIRSKGTF